MSERPVIAAFRPPDDRAEEAARVIEAAGGEALIDPMIAPEPTGATPPEDADFTIFTSSTAAELPAIRSWSAEGTTVVAIGPKTAAALEGAGIEVDIVPETYTSEGLVDALESLVERAQIELARSDHGSEALPAGLEAAGATVNETVLYRLVRPSSAGGSIDATIAGEVNALAFTSSLTVEHFLDIAEEQGVRPQLDDALDAVVVGAIGPPTAETADARGLHVDLIAEEATFESLIDGLMAALQRSTRSA